MLCVSAACAVVRCLSVRPSVCPSVTLVYSVETNKHLFTIGSHTILVFPYQTSQQYSDGDPLTGGVEGRYGGQKLRFPTNIIIIIIIIILLLLL